MVELKVLVDCDSWDAAHLHLKSVYDDPLCRVLSFRLSIPSSEFAERVQDCVRVTGMSYS